MLRAIEALKARLTDGHLTGGPTRPAEAKLQTAVDQGLVHQNGQADVIPLVDLKAQYERIRSDIDTAMQRVIESTSFIMGPDVRAFEEAFAAYCGVAHCIGVSSGTAALTLALRVLGIGPGDEVITVAHTFIATAEAICSVGAQPVFVDIDRQTYTLDPELLVEAITPATRAIIAVHLYGQPADMNQINQSALLHGLPVIEDAAQAHGAAYGGIKTGGLATLGCFSFYPGKNLGAYGDAGAVTTNDMALAEQVRLLRNHGRRSKYVHEQVGYGERMDTLQAAILAAKLPYLAEWTAARRRLAMRYNEGLAGCDLVLPVVGPDAEHAWHLYVIRTPRRDELLDHLKLHGVEAGIHYPVPLHVQPAFMGLPPSLLPVTEEVSDTCLSLPLYPELTEQQQERIIALIRAFLT
jgi:dTDP-4-amino-4,6-dideoxygalactose transaminase